MAAEIKSFFHGVLTASLADTYISPALTRGTVHNATYSNPTAGVVTLEVKIIVESGDPAISIIPPTNLAKNEVFLAVELVNKTVGPGGRIQASGLALECEISGAESPVSS